MFTKCDSGFRAEFRLPGRGPVPQLKVFVFVLIYDAPSLCSVYVEGFHFK